MYTSRTLLFPPKHIYCCKCMQPARTKKPVLQSADFSSENLVTTYKNNLVTECVQIFLQVDNYERRAEQDIYADGVYW